MEYAEVRPGEAEIRYDFAPGVYGIDRIRDYSRGIYDADVFAQELGPGSTCVNAQAKKTYTITSASVDGVFTEGACDVYELDLSRLGVPFADLRNPQRLQEVIAANRNQIVVHKLQLGVPYEIPPMVLHQTYGQGDLHISVLSDYKPEIFMETDDIDLASFVKPK